MKDDAKSIFSPTGPVQTKQVRRDLFSDIVRVVDHDVQPIFLVPRSGYPPKFEFLEKDLGAGYVQSHQSRSRELSLGER